MDKIKTTIIGGSGDVRIGKKSVEMDCECGCCAIKVEDFTDETVGITFQTSYLNRQNGRLKRAFNAFKDKETYYAETVNYKKDVIHFLEEALYMLKAPAQNKFDLKIEGGEKKKDEIKLFWD